MRRLPSRTAGHREDVAAVRGLSSQGRSASGSVRRAVRSLSHDLLLEGRAHSVGVSKVKHHSTTRWIALFALALLMLVPATQPAIAAAPPITVPFDHLTTGFELDGVHRDLPCEQCHLNAIFKGTPRDCGTCHITNSLFNATPKTATHILSTNNCAACHDTTSFRPSVHFTHAEVMGS